MSNPPTPPVPTTDITIRITYRDDGAPARAEVVLSNITVARAFFMEGGPPMTGGVGHRRWVTVARAALTAAHGAWERGQRKAKREGGA